MRHRLGAPVKQGGGLLKIGMLEGRTHQGEQSRGLPGSRAPENRTVRAEAVDEWQVRE